jgi:hypothetical protein
MTRSLLLFFSFLLASAPAFSAPFPQSCQGLIAPPSAVSIPVQDTSPPYMSAFQTLAKEAAASTADLFLVGDSILGRWRPAWRSQAFPRLKTFDIGIDGDPIQGVLWQLQNGNLPAKPPRDTLPCLWVRTIWQVEPAPSKSPMA